MTVHSRARRSTSALLLGFAVGVATGWSLPLGDQLAIDESTTTHDAAAPIDAAAPRPQSPPAIDVDDAVDVVDPGPKRAARIHSVDLAGRSSVVAPDELLLLLCD